MTQTRLHHPMVGMITFTLRERLALLLWGRLYFLTRKPIEITWTIRYPKAIGADHK